MSINIPSFPILSNRIFEKIGFSSENYCFYSIKNDEKFDLICEPSKTYSDEYIIKSPKNYSWSVDNDLIGINRTIKFSSPNDLFGIKGIAPKNSKIGVAVLWSSSDSHQRGCFEVGIIENGNKDCSFIINTEFKKGKLRGLVSLTLILYIHEAGNISEDEKFLANTKGYIIGYIDSINFILDGDGSIFPIYFEEKSADEPLWRVVCEWVDPEEDKFAESVRIIINTNNPSFQFINHEQETYNKFMFQEIISSCLLIIIEKLKDEPCWKTITSGSGKPRYDGSVSSAIKYIIDTFNLDTSSIENLSLSLHENGIKGID